MDFKALTNDLTCRRAVTCLNDILVLIDGMADRYNVFKGGFKSDASYMLVAGIHDQSHMTADSNRVQLVKAMDDDQSEVRVQTVEDLCDLNSTEIIAALSLELLQANERIRNPISNEPFSLKLGE